MLDDVIGNYIDSLTEREFDAPFRALLSLHGFVDIHFLHGSFEFGKDFIAKRVEDGASKQYAFQTKLGISGSLSGCRVKDRLRSSCTNSLSHPNFDRDIPAPRYFVTTGRLVWWSTSCGSRIC